MTTDFADGIARLGRVAALIKREGDRLRKMPLTQFEGIGKMLVISPERQERLANIMEETAQLLDEFAVALQADAEHFDE